jgi:N-terminal domain of galactosyltransferase
MENVRVEQRQRMIATVCVPWRPSPSRMKPYDRVRRFWAETFPDWPVITEDSDTEIFSASQARNNAVRKAATEIVVVADADTIPDADNVVRAVADPTGVTWPYTTWRLIPAEYADRPLDEFPRAPALIDPHAIGGVMVTTVDEYWRLGGQPEEFHGWGYEDRAFQYVAQALSECRRIPGAAYSIDHQADSPGWSRELLTPNAGLVKLYQIAADKPRLMREIVDTPYERRKYVTLPENDPLIGRYWG